MHALDPLGRGDQRDQADRRRPDPLHGLDRRSRRVSGSEHGVEQDDVAVCDVAGQLDEVLDRLERLLVAEEPDEADTRARDERKHGVEHPDSRTQDRADGDLLAGDAAPGSPLERRLDLDLLVREILRGLVREEQRELVHELSEHLRRRRDVA